ncbi:MAG: hypothetical protein KGK08_14720 [Acidobacteriota bacterium]|nr:hypothetical protein [Acidobacteriota bacterium]
MFVTATAPRVSFLDKGWFAILKYYVKKNLHQIAVRRGGIKKLLMADLITTSDAVVKAIRHMAGNYYLSCGITGCADPGKWQPIFPPKIIKGTDLPFGKPPVGAPHKPGSVLPKPAKAESKTEKSSSAQLTISSASGQRFTLRPVCEVANDPESTAATCWVSALARGLDAGLDSVHRDRDGRPALPGDQARETRAATRIGGAIKKTMAQLPDSVTVARELVAAASVCEREIRVYKMNDARTGIVLKHSALPMSLTNSDRVASSSSSTSQEDMDTSPAPGSGDSSAGGRFANRVFRPESSQSVAASDSKLVRRVRRRASISAAIVSAVFDPPGAAAAKPALHVLEVNRTDPKPHRHWILLQPQAADKFDANPQSSHASAQQSQSDQPAFE